MSLHIASELEDIEGVVYIAWCPEHGLHGERQECFACGGEVEQVPMMSLEAGFRDLVSVARALLDCHYPADLFDAQSADNGSRFVAKLRDALGEVGG